MFRINLLYVMAGGRPGGAEQNLLTVIKALNKTQYKITVCLLRSSDILEAEFESLGVPVFVLGIRGKRDIFLIFRLSRFMRREKIDIVHGCLYVSNAIGRLAAIMAGVPIKLAWEQGEVLIEILPWHYRLDRILAGFSDTIVVCSKAVKESIIKREAIPANKIRVIYNCVDLARFARPLDTLAIRNQWGIRPDEILIGTIASLANKIKGQEYLIRALPLIIKVYPKVRLLLVGEGPSKAVLVKIIDTLQLRDKVILAGFRRDAPEIMNSLDIYVCPSIHEGLGISIIEAMSLKKPVVATNVDGIPEVVIDHQTGLLVPPRDADRIAQAIISLLADREKMRQMGEAGFARVKALFSLESVIKEIEALYKELLWKIHPSSQS